MRSLNVARVLLLATTLCVSSTALAQKHGKKGGGTKKPAPAAAANSGGEIELDAPDPNAAAAQPAQKPVDNSPPPQAGQMTEAAAQAKRLFDGEKWQDAAIALDRVRKGETQDDEGNKQLAQYHLAIALYRLKFY
ncbi:MAG: hypothetical protein ABI551_02365, partial [Polyangiaceae bacterium]